MAKVVNKPTGEKGTSVEEKLRMLYKLQTVVSKVDNINILRGELPLEVRDLEDGVAGLKTRIDNFEGEVKDLNTAISNKKVEIKESQALIKKYNEQLENVQNNREYDSLSKEIEFQTLEVEFSEKKIKEHATEVKLKKEQISSVEVSLKEQEKDLLLKKEELEKISSETAVEEEKLKKDAVSIEGKIEERLLTAFKRIRKNALNGLSVVVVQRDACGGCFNKIPPQRQVDIASRKKVIVCEYCGRILIDEELAKAVNPG